MFYLALPGLTLTVGFPELRCLSRTTLDSGRPRLRLWRSGHGGAGRCRTLRSRSWSDSGGGGRLCCRLSSVAAAAVSACPCGSRRCPQCRSVRASGVRQATSGVCASGQPLPAGRVDLACVSSADERAQGVRCCHGAAKAAVGPPQPAGQPDTATGVQGVAEPDTADAVAVCCCFRNRGRVSGRLAGVRTVGVHRGHCRSLRCPLLQEPVVRSASAGRLPPPPIGVGELALQPVAEPGAHVGHRRALQGQASSAVSPPNRRPSSSPRCQPLMTPRAATYGSIPTLAQVPRGQARSSTVRSATNTSSPGVRSG
jgi:hypothetical protein